MKIATAGVIWKDSKILIARRMKDDYWEFPGGRIDPGETPEECLVREIKEELDVDISIDNFIAKIEGFYRGQDMQLFAYHAMYQKGRIVLDVHSEVKWIEPCELTQYSIVEEDCEIVKILKPLIEGNERK